MYIYIYIYYHENNMPSRLSPQWLCSNRCTWAHDVHHVAKCMSFLQRKLEFYTRVY